MSHHVKRTINLFSSLRSFPGMKKIITLSIIEIFVISIFSVLYTAFAVNLTLQTYGLFIHFILFWSSILYLPAILGYIINKGDTILSFRRIVILDMICTSLIFILLVVLSAIEIVVMLKGFGIYIAVGVITAFRIIIYFNVGSKKLIRRVVAALSYPTLFICLDILFLAFIMEKQILLSSIDTYVIILDLIVWSGSAFIFLKLVDMPAQQILQVSGLELFRGFVATYLENYDRLFENSLDKISQTREINIKIIEFKRERKERNVAVILPLIHPGPMKTVGSSNLPGLLITHLKDIINPVVMHSTTTHGFNVPKKEYILDLTKLLQKEILKNNSFSEPQISRIIHYETQKYIMIFQRINDTLFIAIGSKDGLVDDISAEIGELLEEEVIGKLPFINNVFIVDMHNGIVLTKGESIYFENNETLHLIESVLEGLEKNKDILEKVYNDFYVGYGNEFINLPLSEGYGPGGVQALFYDIGHTQKVLFIIFDGNNMKLDFRKWIIDQIKQNYTDIDIVEIFTTDTHAVNGISREGFGYHPVGEKGDWDTIFEKVKGSVDMALRDAQPSKIRVNKIKYTTKILGEKKVDALLNIIVVSAKLAKYLIYILGFSALLLTYIIVAIT